MKVGVVTDVHLCPASTPPGRWHNELDFDGVEARLRRGLAAHGQAGVDLIALLGDLVNFGDEASHRRGLAAIAETGLPMRAVQGNHDCDEAVDRLGERIAGFDRLALATTTGEMIGGIRVAGLPISRGSGRGNWRVEEPDVAAWGAELVVLLSHFPVVSREAAARDAELRYAGDLANRAVLETMLTARPAPTLVLHGHLHIRDAAVVGPLLQIGCAALVEPPYEVATVTIEANGEERLARVRHAAVAPSSVASTPTLSAAEGVWRYEDHQWIDASKG